ncbi:MAG: 23S rRNA (adenine(2503)-C(2))-methyltransferase RlmN [Erysipelotrichaceae bacterium]
MISLYDQSYDELKEFSLNQGWKAYRGHQIFRWLYRQRVMEIEEMSDLKKETRDILRENFTLAPLQLRDKQISKDGTRKYLFTLSDGSLIESVLMSYEFGKSICVTSQVGCNMGCAFCASGLLKKKRDLTAGEMVAQVLMVQKDLDENQERLSHIVVMGTGEPFDNYDNLMKFLKIVNDDQGLGIGARHITISTCGIVPRIYDFSKEHTQYNLAISLHAPNDELRNELMPINKAYPLDELMKAIDVYMSENNRRLTFEYILLRGVNDKKEHIAQLAKLVKGINAYVNLIPYNAVDENGYQGVDYPHAMRFYDALMKLGVRCTIRKEHGGDIDAACGQLRAKHMRKNMQEVIK